MNKKNKLKTFIERNKKSNGYLLRKTSFNVFYKIIRFVLLFGLCFMILQPLLNKISISFMEEQDLYDSTIVAIPRHFTLSNYQIAAYLMKYWQVRSRKSCNRCSSYNNSGFLVPEFPIL